jgi:hypothetical protein
MSEKELLQAFCDAMEAKYPGIDGLSCIADEIDEFLASRPKPTCCLNHTHTNHWSDGYTQKCKIHGTKETTDTGWNRW